MSKTSFSPERKALVFESVHESAMDRIRRLRQEKHDSLALFFDLSVSDLARMLPAAPKNRKILEDAMIECMLLGDKILKKDELTIRYYSDNLHPDRPSWVPSFRR